MAVSKKEDEKRYRMVIYQRFRIYGNSKIRERIVKNLRKLRLNSNWRFALIWPKVHNDQKKPGKVNKCVVSYSRYFANVKRQLQNQAAQYSRYYFDEINKGFEDEQPIKMVYTNAHKYEAENPIKIDKDVDEEGQSLKTEDSISIEYSTDSANPDEGDQPIKGEDPISNDDAINNVDPLKSVDPVKTDCSTKQDDVGDGGEEKK